MNFIRKERGDFLGSYQFSILKKGFTSFLGLFMSIQHEYAIMEQKHPLAVVQYMYSNNSGHLDTYLVEKNTKYN